MSRPIFPSSSNFSVVQLAAFSVASIAFVVIDAVSAQFGVYSTDFGDLFAVATLSIIFALAGFFRVCEYLFVAAYIVANVFDVTGGFGSVSFGLPILMTFWLMRSWIIPAAVVMLVDGATSIAVSLTPQLQVFSFLFTGVLVWTIGLALRWHNGHRIAAEAEKNRAHAASAQNWRELARQLHDTTAKDLAHVAVLAQDIASRHPDLADELGALEQAATGASRRIRPMILSISTSASETPLSEVIVQVSRMLKTRNITLNTTVSDNLDGALTRQQQLTGALAIRECTSNILKYAPAGSEADLVVDTDAEPGVLAISLSNEIAFQPVLPGISGGYGLANLGDKIAEEGGKMDITNLDGRWLTYLTLPAASAKAEIAGAAGKRHERGGHADER